MGYKQIVFDVDGTLIDTEYGRFKEREACTVYAAQRHAHDYAPARGADGKSSSIRHKIGDSLEFYFCESAESIIVLVMAGYGISVLPDFLVPDDLSLVKIPLKDTEALSFGIYYQSMQGKPGLKAFIQCAKEELA